MLNLKPGIDLHEVVLASDRLDQELDCSSIGVANTLAKMNSVAKNGIADLKVKKNLIWFSEKTFSPFRILSLVRNSFY